MTKHTWVRIAVLLIAANVGCWFTAGRFGFAAHSAELNLRRPPIVGVANIGLRVSDLAKSKEFYSHKLGFDLAFTSPGPDGDRTSYFKVNDHQYVELSPDLQPGEDRLIHIGLETTDVRALRAYLAAHRVKVPAKVSRLPDGTLGFEITDPDGHRVQFVQYVASSQEAKHYGKFLSPRRLSDHILHVGVTVQDPHRADALYQNVLDLHDFWNAYAAGGCCEDMRLPNGTDWVEYMVHTHPLPLNRLGGAHHFCLGVDNVQEVFQEALKRALQPTGRIKKPRIGHDGKWQFNLSDPDRTRVEIMAFKPVAQPNPPFTP